MKNEGSITLYFSMLVLLFLLLVSACLEGIYMYVGKGKASAAYMACLSSTQGNYQKELHEMYHLFGLDSRYQKQLEKDVKEKLTTSLVKSNDNFQYRIGTVTCNDFVTLTDQKGEVLKHQIREYMKYEIGKDGIESLSSQFLKQPSQKAIEDSKGVIEKAQNDEKKAQKDEKNKNQSKEIVTNTVEDPRKGLMKLLKNGVVSLVMEDRDVSKREISIKYGTKDTTTEKKIDFFQADSVTKQMDEGKTNEVSQNMSSELMSVLYATKMFHHVASNDHKKGVQYEVEYLIAGKSCDEDNLSSVFHRILLIRFLSNFIYVQNDAAKVAEATALSASILGITGIAPLVEVGKQLLLAALAYGESILDLRNLVAGNLVPTIKTGATWQLEFSGLASLHGTKKTGNQGLSYENYLQLLLLMQSKKNEKYMRMMDVIEDNMKQKISSFSLDQCYATYKINVAISLLPFRFGGMGIPLIQEYPLKYSRITTY